MHHISEDLIKEYRELKQANQGNFSWWNYVNYKADLQTALAFAEFYNPAIVDSSEVGDLFLLKDKYDADLLEQWRIECRGDKKGIEKMMNLYEIKDFFHIHINENEDNVKQIIVLGETLKSFWNLSFTYRFPDKRINVTVFEEWDSLFITVYEERDPTRL